MNPTKASAKSPLARGASQSMPLTEAASGHFSPAPKRCRARLSRKSKRSSTRSDRDRGPWTNSPFPPRRPSQAPTEPLARIGHVSRRRLDTSPTKPLCRRSSATDCDPSSQLRRANLFPRNSRKFSASSIKKARRVARHKMASPYQDLGARRRSALPFAAAPRRPPIYSKISSLV